MNTADFCRRLPNVTSTTLRAARALAPLVADRGDIGAVARRGVDDGDSASAQHQCPTPKGYPV